MSDLMRLRVVTAFNNYRVGDIIERIPSVARDMLARRWYGRKMVEEIVAPVELLTVELPPAIETKNEAGPVEAWRSERKHKSKRGNHP